ncbi:MAG: LLM class flavin-dependent oxidoreductase [Candidatus Caldarchaeum sp.]|nr:LLM class flavin-dependent oxidoreductase [Candidatus Caldarchaeum sp.]
MSYETGLSKIGLAFLSDQYEPDAIVKLAVKAERNRAGAVWLAEHYCSTDVFSVLGALAVNTSRIKLGTSIVSPFIRHPMTVATASATIASLSGGRFILGVGAGFQRWVEDYLGLPYKPVLSRMAESVNLIRGVLSGDGCDFQGRWFRARNSKITPKPPKYRIPLYLGAVGDKMKSLAFQVADGLILSAGSSLDYVMKTCEELQRRKVSKRFEIVVLTFISINRNSQAAKNALKPEIATILSRPGRAERMLASHKLDPEWFAELRKSVENQDRDKIRKLITDDMVDQLAAAGTADETLEYLSRLTKLKAVSIALVPIKNDMKAVFKLVRRASEQTL